VKKHWAKIILVKFLILYGLSLYGGHVFVLNDTVLRSQQTNNTSIISFLPNETFSHSIKTENFLGVNNNLPVSFSRNHYNSFLIRKKTAECFQQHSFYTYLFYAEHAEVQFPPVELIYPFHYFM